MITSPPLLLTLFAGTIIAVKFLAARERTRGFFKYLPVPLWCYFIPTLLSTAGLIPSESPFYDAFGRTLLPACLVLLLVGTDLPALLRLSRKAVLAMAAGSVGIFCGGLASFVLLYKLQPGHDPAMQAQLWKGWGCLSASWTGGSANMLAVKEILLAPAGLFSNLIITDAFGAYTWMAVLVFCSQYQPALDRWLGASPPSSGESVKAGARDSRLERRPWGRRIAGVAALLAFGFALGEGCWILSKLLPSFGALLTRFTWAIVLATTLPLLLSLTPARRLEDLGAEKTGTFLLYLLLTSIGARANLTTLHSAPLFVGLGLLWVLIQGGILLLLGKLFRIPMSLLATASQANVGGTISTPLVASVYDKNLAPVGVILAVLGNIYGTYFGLLFAQICRSLANLL